MLSNNKLVIFTITLILSLLFIAFIDDTFNYAEKFGIISVNNNWQYRFKDSPIDSTGRLVWLNDSWNSSKWTSVEELNKIPSSNQNSIWLRTIIPDEKFILPVLHLCDVDQILQVYLNGEKIYQFGNFEKNDNGYYQGRKKHLVPLPEGYEGNIVYFRIWSGGTTIGMDNNVLLGSANKIQACLFFQDADVLCFAILFIFLGIGILVFSKSIKLLKSISFFLFSFGFFLIGNSTYLHTAINAPKVFYYIDVASFFSLPIASYFLVEQIIDEKYKIIIRRFWQAHLIFLIMSIVPLIRFNYHYISIFNKTIFISFTLSVIVNTAFIIKNMRKDRFDIKMLLIGEIIFYIFSYTEFLLFDLGYITPHLHWIHYGALGFVICLFWIVIDRYRKSQHDNEIAQKKMLEAEKYKELDQMKSRFFANVSHEFRTPLTLIMGTAEQVMDMPIDDQVKQKSQLQLQNGRRLLNLVNELLDLTKLDAGQIELKVEAGDIVSQIKNIANTFHSALQQNNIQINIHNKTDSLVLFYDLEKIEKVITNLISNAVKFTPTNGKIDIALTENEMLEIKVTDTGSGIAPEHLPYIFNRFYQADNGNQNDQNGSGIGLALARDLVKLHHGDILVESEPGKGSSFIVQLPLEKGELSNIETQSQISRTDGNEQLDAQQPAQSKSQSKQQDMPIILITEDNSDLRTYIAEILPDSYEILEAENGQAGFDLATSHIPDLIISDVMMPEMDGYQLCEKLKTDERTCHIPVILLTARSDKQSKIEGLTLGADDYIAKPFESDELRVRISNLIEQRKKLRELFGREIIKPGVTPHVPSGNQQFFDRISHIIESNISNKDISVDWLSEELSLSRSQLHRKIKGLTDSTPTMFIRSIRLKKAAEMLKNNSGMVKEIAYQTGFSSPNYFRRCFKEEFGVSPKDYSAE